MQSRTAYNKGPDQTAQMRRLSDTILLYGICKFSHDETHFYDKWRNQLATKITQ